ncbi:diacylglycerol kinase [Actinomyces bowdenii]|uniref:diacylglycerol/lipid kinase family protein n=1 Tax=Actinomyces bowdenii TaxID=131109 RepID=UPI00214B63A5|nr:diacylglycerol kinase family protein [Actinomyces bowdenii]MCR2052505.1 diacylglycerol kinase [Actinomyces bowdenii]
MRIALLSNPCSGRGRHARADDEARLRLMRAGHEVLHVRTGSYEQARSAASALMAQDADALVVVGGDGMVHLGLEVVAGTGVPLGIVATGTGNDIARHFGLPSRDVAVCTRIIDAALSGRTGTGRVLAVDAMRATRPDGTVVAGEHQWSLAVVSAGFDAAVNARANLMTWPAGEGRYLRAVMAELAALAPYGYRITTDSGTWEGPALLAAVANTRYFGGGMDLAPQADACDGMLEVLRLDPVGRVRLLGLLRRLLAGTHLDSPHVHLERTASVTIEALDERTGQDHGLRPPPRPYADGEPLAPLPLRLSAVPQAVRLLLPAPACGPGAGGGT